jgi:uncharacterized protein (DUF305 family)
MWQHPSRRRQLLALAAAFGLSACSADRTTGPASPDESVSQEALRPLLSKAASDKRTARFEIDYMKFSIAHHTVGIRMAELCVKKAVHEEAARACEKSIAMQKEEIQKLHTWLDVPDPLQAADQAA